ncbi:MAG: transposase family protein [Holosporaceae bacterium]|jgi:hypothetical protein|nr:transposase family protein [Holosporaceae bacterium]
MIKYEKIKEREDVFFHLFGVNVSEFELILQKIEAPWQEEIVDKYKRPGRFCSLDLRGHLMMLLLYYKHCITQEFIGTLFNLHKANVCRGIKKLEPLLAKVMNIPKRDGLSHDEVKDLIDNG